MTNNKIHVMHIASGDIWAGAEAQLYTLAKELQKSDKVKVSVVLMNYGALEQKIRHENIDIYVFDETKLNGIRISLNLLRLFHRLRPDVIHTHGKKENVISSFCSLFFSNIISIRTAHGAPEQSPSPLYIHKWLYNFSDWFAGRFLQHRIVAVSEDLKMKLGKHFPEKYISVVQNGLDIHAIKNNSPKRDYNKPIETGIFRIGFAGRLVPVKRVDLFIRIAQVFISANPEITATFHIHGTGPLEDELKTLSQESGTGDSIIFEGHTNNMLEALGKMDILVMISDHEGLPMILLEAMACELPIVSHAVGGIPELLEYGQCGILIKNQDPEEYANAIYQLISKHSERKSLSQNAYKHLCAQNTSKSNADSYINIYSDLTTHKGLPG